MRSLSLNGQANVPLQQSSQRYHSSHFFFDAREALTGSDADTIVSNSLHFVNYHRRSA